MGGEGGEGEGGEGGEGAADPLATWPALAPLSHLWNDRQSAPAAIHSWLTLFIICCLCYFLLFTVYYLAQSLLLLLLQFEQLMVRPIFHVKPTILIKDVFEHQIILPTCQLAFHNGHNLWTL